MVLYQSCRAGKRVHSGVPCKLNNEKHEQTPWTILIETKLFLKHVKYLRCKNSQRKFLSKAKSELMNLILLIRKNH